MTDFIKALFEYACHSGLDLQYMRELEAVRGQCPDPEPLRSALYDAMTPEQRPLLERYLEAEMALHWAQEEVLFRCGLSAGLSLGFSAQPVPRIPL